METGVGGILIVVGVFNALAVLNVGDGEIQEIKTEVSVLVVISRQVTGKLCNALAQMLLFRGVHVEGTHVHHGKIGVGGGGQLGDAHEDTDHDDTHDDYGPFVVLGDVFRPAPEPGAPLLVLFLFVPGVLGSGTLRFRLLAELLYLLHLFIVTHKNASILKSIHYTTVLSLWQ